MADRKKLKKRQAFLDEVKEVERRHGMRLAVYQPQPRMVVEETGPEQPAN